MLLDIPPQRFTYWLKGTKELQERTYGYDFAKLAQDPAELARYLFWNTFAAQQELAETAVEFSWKPWAVDRPFVNRERVIAELVDVLHFVGNELVGMGVTDQELNSAYEAKVQLNRARQASGKYSAQKGGLGDGSDLG